jgi:NTP pyrophosphatase (non-canonical NTP hydrolase)
MHIYEIQKQIYDIAFFHGWHDGAERSFGDIIALCHSELSEALESFRNDGDIVSIKIETTKDGREKPTGVPIELADCIIRILDYCQDVGIDMEEAIKMKCEYNKTRTYRHGGKII